MQKIHNIMPPKSISITTDQAEFIENDMIVLGAKTFSEYIRLLINNRIFLGEFKKSKSRPSSLPATASK